MNIICRMWGHRAGPNDMVCTRCGQPLIRVRRSFRTRLEGKK